MAKQSVTRYDLVFVCDNDIPYDDTWDRSGEANRSSFQEQVLGDLREHKIPFIVLRGSIEERVRHVKHVLARFRKYMNALDLFNGVVR